MARVPVIDLTDLYHPHQDPGDNIDILTAYALPEIDLRLTILDATERFRHQVAWHENPHYRDPTGPREPGVIPMSQLNYLFGRNVPWMWGPFTAMRSPEDRMGDIPRGQQLGIEAFLDALRASPEPVHVLVFCSCRVLAAAWNREPRLLREKIAMVHLGAGASEPGYLEWNVMLDQHALVAVLRSDLPVRIYPCATAQGPFDLGRHNTYWALESLACVYDMEPCLQAYLAFAIDRSLRHDWLRAVEGRPDMALLDKVAAHRNGQRGHNVWETAQWIAVSGRRLVRRADGSCRIVPPAEVAAGDTMLPNDFVPCTVEVAADGIFTWKPTSGPARCWMYDRVDPAANEAALRQALPALYRSFRT